MSTLDQAARYANDNAFHAVTVTNRLIVEVESDEDLAGMYADFGQQGAVTLSGAGNAVVSITGILDRPSRLSGALPGVRSSAATLRLPASAVPVRPARSDSVIIGGVAWRVEGIEADESGAELMIELSAA